MCGFSLCSTKSICIAMRLLKACVKQTYLVFSLSHLNMCWEHIKFCSNMCKCSSCGGLDSVICPKTAFCVNDCHDGFIQLLSPFIAGVAYRINPYNDDTV